MRLAVLDTNVIVSAGIRAEGPPAQILMDWVLEGLLQVVTCPQIEEEYREVVRREKFRRYGFPPLWLEFVIDESLRLPDPAPWPHSLPDAGDAPFLAIAKAAGAWLVSGNAKHFPKVARDGVTVVSPGEYLEFLRAGVADV